MGLLKPIVGGRIRAITWKRDDGGLDKLGIIPSARGIRFVKRDDEGKLAGLFVPYFYTPAMFGGYRKWFACPGCRRAARILYGVHSLRCRRCRGLKYASQSEASHWRAQRKALSIRRRVGATGDALDRPYPPKPRKMRWATYKRLRAVDAALQEQWLLGAAGDLGPWRDRDMCCASYTPTSRTTTGSQSPVAFGGHAQGDGLRSLTVMSATRSADK